METDMMDEMDSMGSIDSMDGGEAGGPETVTMYRPTGPEELDLVRRSGFRAWPPRLPEQPIFYPVTNEEYARQIAVRWNVPERGAGYVTRFRVRREFAERYEIHQVGGKEHTEWWIPAEDLDELNRNIVGEIEVIGEYGERGGGGGS